MKDSEEEWQRWEQKVAQDHEAIMKLLEKEQKDQEEAVVEKMVNVVCEQELHQEIKKTFAEMWNNKGQLFISIVVTVFCLLCFLLFNSV